MFVIKPILLKKFQKALSLLLAVLILVNPLVVPVAYAEGENDAGATPTPTAEVSPSPAPTDQAPTDRSPTPTDQAPSSTDSSNQGSEVTPSPSPATQTITPSPEPTQTPTPPAESENLSPTPTPQSTITTGNADASSQTDTTVNKNQDMVSGDISTPTGSCTPPEGQTNCPNDINISNNNQATVSGATDSLANTGDNQESGSGGDATITTGDATASGQMLNDINSNTVVATPSSTSTPTPTTTLAPESNSSESTPTPTSEVKNLEINNENDGKVTNGANISANTGGNLASENLGNVDLKTGDALAWLNLINFLNTNIVGSNFEFLVLDVKDDSGEINLNELWKKLQEQSSSDSIFLVGDQSSPNMRLIIRNENKATLENNINVCATTGNNQANQNNSAQVNTGDATALANVTNIVNTNVLGSNFFFGIINITGQFKGNLILPRPERFLGVGSSGVSGTATIFANQNSASVSDTLSSSANTGNNQVNNNGGNNTISTGDANASSRDLSLINLNLYQNDWFYLLMNVLGEWNGKTYSWSNPEVVEKTTGSSQAYEAGGQSSATANSPEVSSTDIGSTLPVDFQNQNTADVRNNVNVSASTGENQANGNANGSSLKTGNAKASLNLLNLINLNILASRWFMGLVNVLGNWSGNMIYAYPDLAVSLSGSPDEVAPGDLFEYTLNFVNQGYDDAGGVTLKMDFPRGLNYEGDDSGIPASCDSQSCRWVVGSLKRDEGGSFKVKVKLDPNFFDLNQVSFWQKIIPQVYAAEEQSSFIVQAEIITSEPESNQDNNISAKQTMVVEKADSSGNREDNSVDQRQPILEITVKNNVNDFVYLGDTVSFEVTVENKSDVPAYNAVFLQKLYNHVPGDLGTIRIPLGTINPGKKGKLTFGILLKKESTLEAGNYYTLATVEGNAPNGNLVTSNQARTDFKVRLKEISSLLPQSVLAKEWDEESILGASSQCPTPSENIFPYVMLFVLSSLWIVEKSRKFSRRLLLKK